MYAPSGLFLYFDEVDEANAYRCCNKTAGYFARLIIIASRFLVSRCPVSSLFIGAL